MRSRSNVTAKECARHGNGLSQPQPPDFGLISSSTFWFYSGGKAKLEIGG